MVPFHHPFKIVPLPILLWACAVVRLGFQLLSEVTEAPVHMLEPVEMGSLVGPSFLENLPINYRYARSRCLMI